MLAGLPSQNFRPRLFGVGAWTDNIPFACDLIATTKPRVLVELGTDRGESYFTFCQAVAENLLPTRCFAIDTWLGDEQAGRYDETTFAEVSDHNWAHYQDFSTLLRGTFDEALSHFAADSVDLLHLDGLHTEAAVCHDIDAWLPKIAPGGILLLHDVNVRTRGFGVWKVWEELQTRGRSYTFADGAGLGVWQKPPVIKLAEPVEIILSGTHETVAQLSDYYRERASALHEEIARQWRDGSIRETVSGRQTTVQVFHTHDGIHREEDSLVARVGHEAWKDVSILLPPGAGTAPLRIDFFSAYTTIELAAIRLTTGEVEKFNARDSAGFNQITVAGDAERLAHANHLRLRVTGPDPQLYLPVLSSLPNESPLRVELRLRVSAMA